MNDEDYYSQAPHRPSTKTAVPQGDNGAARAGPPVEIGEIEDGIPLPPMRTGRLPYPFNEMRVGQSFLVKGASGARLAPRIAAAKKREVNQGKEFTTRTTPSGVRVWRTK